MFQQGWSAPHFVSTRKLTVLWSGHIGVGLKCSPARRRADRSNRQVLWLQNSPGVCTSIHENRKGHVSVSTVRWRLYCVKLKDYEAANRMPLKNKNKKKKDFNRPWQIIVGDVINQDQCSSQASARFNCLRINAASSLDMYLENAWTLSACPQLWSTKGVQ